MAKKVLWIDDNAEERLVGRTILNGIAGVSPEVAGSSEEARTLQWPAKERPSFQARLEREGWTDWFSQSTIGDKPWVIHMTPAFLDHCLDFTERLLDAFGKFVFDTQRRMPPDPNMPNFLRSGS